MDAWSAYQQQHQERFLQELFELLRIPSVSADSGHKADMLACAEVVKSRLLEAGADLAEVCPTAGHPIVYGEKIAGKDLPTVLVYGHYDVQPPDPLDLWKTNPFEPVIREGKIFARGSSDDKGQMFMHVKALEVMVRTSSLPCNVKFMIEGEEEVGSDNLGKFLKARRQQLTADIVLISDTSMISLEHPSIEVGLRGLAYMEVEVTGPERDLHSGVFGGAIANPVTILCQMIASLHDEKNHITIPGFYDQVTELSGKERKALNEAPFNETDYRNDLGLKKLWGEEGYTSLERTGTRPTLEVNGIWGGYTGEGTKTVLPSKAHAKISMRLVPNQKSGEIARLFTAHMQKIAPDGISIRVQELHGGEPVITPTDSPGYQAASKAIQSTYGKTPIPTRGGGSIPIVALFKEVLGLDTVLMGFGLDSDNLHSPNEKFDLDCFYKGIATIPYFHKFFAELKMAYKGV
jgi:acetylornithine deacetylase/succinyl-diaminopimelate desuccinylase-like protein